MYGFQPKHARGKPVQKLADGGLVHSITGMLGMRPRTREELLAADAKAQERNKEAAARVAARAQAAPPAPAPSAAPVAAITEYAGLSALQRREKEQGLKDGGTVKPRGFKAGGMIRGPGTGTSDSIAAKKKPGTFIMPADSTAAIGPDALEELGEPMNGPQEEVDEPQADGPQEEMTEAVDGPKEEQAEAVPVRLSNGEFELPPEQVQALGEAVLTVMRDATHKKQAGGGAMPTAKGFAPHQFFSSGGVVQDEAKQRLANQTAMYVRGAQEAAANRTPEPAASSPTPAISSQRAAAHVPATQVEGWRTKAVMDGAAQDAQAAWDRGGVDGVSGAAGAVARGAITAVPTAVGEFAANTVAPLGDVAKGFWNGLTGGDSTPTAAPSAPRTPATSAAAKVTAPQATAPTAQSPSQAAAPVQNPAPAQALQPAQAGIAVAPGAYRNGPGQYSDNASGMSAPSAFTGQPSAQNVAAADALAGRQGQSTTTGAPQTVAGFQPSGVQSPIVRNSSNDWAARNDLRNLSVAASSITNQPGFSRGGRGYVPLDVAAYQAALQTDAALRQAQPSMDQAAMRENAGIQREGMQQNGAITRTAMQEQGATARESGRTAIAQGELGLKRTASGFQTRAAAQQEALRNVLLDPNATPEQRKIAQRSLSALSGKTAADRMQAVNLPDTVSDQGVVMKGGQALVRTLEDGTVEQVPIRGKQDHAAQRPAPKIGTIDSGYRFKGGDPSSQASWEKV